MKVLLNCFLFSTLSPIDMIPIFYRWERKALSTGHYEIKYTLPTQWPGLMVCKKDAQGINKNLVKTTYSGTSLIGTAWDQQIRD
jgi:hypothetical protein